MQRWISFALRAVFILGFLIVLPVMALPQVAELLDRLLYGHSESTVPPLKADDEHRLPPARTAHEASRAAHEMPLDAEDADRFAQPGQATLASLADVNPPPLKPTPDFLPREAQGRPATRQSEPPTEVGPLDQATAAKIDAVRSRLEKLGAEYVRLEMSADARQFHCLCHMAVNNDPNQVQPFEATRPDPVAAAQAVLANVEAWRTAEQTSAAIQQPPQRSPVYRPR